MEVELLKAFIKFSRGTFKKATWKSSLAKARGEIDEIEKAIDSTLGNQAILEEYADAIMCLVDSANRCGYSADDIRVAFRDKLLKNMGRTWKKNDDDTYSHVKK